MIKTLQTQLAQHLTDDNLATHHHHRGVKGQTTTSALLSLLDTWSTIMEQEVDMITLLIVQSAAYDLVQHSTLLQKLETLGLNNKSMQLMKTYLGNRQQAVTVEGFTSDKLHCHDLSVIQGSGLSTLLCIHN